MEPSILRRGKLFHKRIQTDWEGTIEGKTVRPEHSIKLKLKLSSSTHSRTGRIDIFIDRMSDFVTIVEIKSTDWNKINPKNIPRLLKTHTRQMFKYIDEFLEIEKVSVCAAIIYPTPPKLLELQDLIENYFNENSFQLIWYDESNTSNRKR